MKKDCKKKINNRHKKNNNRQYKVDIFSTTVSIIITIISLTIAIASWNISKASLNISKESLEISNRSYLLSSKDMEPIIDVEVEENGVKVTNNTTDLFKVSEIEAMNVSILEFEEYQVNKHIKVNIPTLSKYKLVPENKRKEKQFYLNFSDPSPVAFNTLTHDDLAKQVVDRLYNEYSLDSKKGFSSFGMRNGVWLIRIGYENEFKEYKSLYFQYRHLYGIGEFQKLQISEEEANKLIEESQVPKYEHIDDYWNIILNDDKYLESYLGENK